MHGAEVYLGCTSGKLNQVWYFYNVRGNAISGEYEATATCKYRSSNGDHGERADRSTVTTSGCPSSGIKYVPKSN